MFYYLVTPGGSATHELYRQLDDKSTYEKNNYRGHDGNFHPHTRNPALVTSGSRVAYVYSNPYDIILYYYKRGFMDTPGHCKTMLGLIDEFDIIKGQTFDVYLDYGKDIFLLADHFFSWFGHINRNYDIMFFKYESLDKYSDILFRWLGSSLKFEYKPRATDWRKQPSHIKKKLRAVYGQLYDFQQDLDPIIVRSAHNNVISF
jgi:hypothetical protein